MEMNGEIIIDVKEICHRVLKKWKMLIFVAIIGAIIVCVMGYANSYKKYLENQPVDENTLESYKSQLSEEERENVEQTYDAYEIYKEQYKSEVEYKKNSLLMKLRTDNIATVNMQYYINNYYESIYPVIEKNNNVVDIIEAYKFYLTSDDVLKKIQETTGADIDGRDLKKIINIEAVENSQTMEISIYSDSQDLSNGIADIIEQEVDSQTKILQEQYGKFELLGGNRCESSEIDSTILELQQKETASIETLRTQIETVGSNLSEPQKTYYNALINCNDSGNTNSNFHAKIVNIKNVAVGCVLGMIVGICWIFLEYIFQGKLRNQNDLRDMYHSYMFGIIKKPEQEIDVIVKQITAFGSCAEVKKIGLIGTDVSEESKEIIRRISSRLEEEKIEIISACGLDSLPETLKEIKDDNQVILVEKKNGSTYRDIERELEMCDKCNVSILGNIVIDIE